MEIPGSLPPAFSRGERWTNRRLSEPRNGSSSSALTSTVGECSASRGDTMLLKITNDLPICYTDVEYFFKPDVEPMSHRCPARFL